MQKEIDKECDESGKHVEKYGRQRKMNFCTTSMKRSWISWKTICHAIFLKRSCVSMQSVRAEVQGKLTWLHHVFCSTRDLNSDRRRSLNWKGDSRGPLAEDVPGHLWKVLSDGCWAADIEHLCVLHFWVEEYFCATPEQDFFNRFYSLSIKEPHLALSRDWFRKYVSDTLRRVIDC